MSNLSGTFFDASCSGIILLLRMIFRRNILISASSILMLLMLVWLTISAPFVSASMQQKAKMEKKMNSASPLAGTEEEKVPSSPSPNTTNEYLHENEELQHTSTTITTSYCTHHTTAYIAFHGELASPPPKA
jgi:hypothetical protein